MTEQILFVDDEPNVLRSIERSLRKRFTLKTAESGKRALELIEQEGPFAVIVSDMQMPEMNGAELLSRVKAQAPETVRMMLTGNADQQTAIDAINQGDILRFLNKPTSAEDIANALEAGLQQHRLMRAEQELLENTLKGSIQALTEVLALANPEIFGRCYRIKTRTVEVVKQLGIDESWEFETIAMLSQVGTVSLQPDLIRKMLAGKSMDEEERRSFTAHAAAGADLIGNIPRMEGVAEAIRYQQKNYDGSGVPRDDIKAENIPLGARILRAVLDLDSLETSGLETHDALVRMSQISGRYDPRVFDALGSTSGSKRAVMKIALDKLTDDMHLADDLSTFSGALLVVMGQATTGPVRSHLFSYYEKEMIDFEIEVWVTT